MVCTCVMVGSCNGVYMCIGTATETVVCHKPPMLLVSVRSH
jgi:hypothetical protein